MQRLTFNTTHKTVVVVSQTGENLFTYDDVKTVKVGDTYYEVMVKNKESAIPVLRVPISNTNMVIEQ
jgi:hypothetical protein